VLFVSRPVIQTHQFINIPDDCEARFLLTVWIHWCSKTVVHMELLNSKSGRQWFDGHCHVPSVTTDLLAIVVFVADRCFVTAYVDVSKSSYRSSFFCN